MLDSIPELKGSSVALGFFDGIHIAHAAVIRAAFEGCGERVVLSVGDKCRSGGGLLTREETAAQLELLGADMLVSPDFGDIKNLSGEEFVHSIIAEKLHAHHVACGFNYRFGAGASCGAAELRSICGVYGIGCTVVPEMCAAGETVSSTAIRAALCRGGIAEVNTMLGRRYGFTLPVVNGQHLGRKLGAPTVNQKMPVGLTLPKYGVYASVALADGRWYNAVTNIGVRPTVGGSEPVGETWLRGFDGTLYGEQVRVELVEFLRPEMKFDSIEELGKQIIADADTALCLTDRLTAGLNG